MANFLFLSTLREAETQTLGSVIWNFAVQQFFAKLEPFFYFLIMVIFPYFHKERCRFSTSVDTQKSREPIFGRIGNLKFCCMMIFFSQWPIPIFHCFSFPFTMPFLPWFSLQHSSMMMFLMLKHKCVVPFNILEWWPLCT